MCFSKDFKTIYILVIYNKMDGKKIYHLINEELTRQQVESIIASKLDSAYSSRDFKKAVKELAGDVINEMFKILWQRNNSWLRASTRV